MTPSLLVWNIKKILKSLTKMKLLRVQILGENKVWTCWLWAVGAYTQMESLQTWKSRTEVQVGSQGSLYFWESFNIKEIEDILGVNKNW